MARASTEPWTSPLMMTFKVFSLTLAMASRRFCKSIFSCFSGRRAFILFLWAYSSASRLASFSFLRALKEAPASGISVQPSILMGVEGKASFMVAPLSSSIARTLQ